jgi:spore coat polysaccharide biosynthesis protein SpsF (cytidylyltransferase family)
MKVLAITQARVGSSRLPAKVLKMISNKTILDIHLVRVLKSKKISKLIVATTFEKGVEQILEIANNNNVQYYQGSTDNVLDRYYQAAKIEKPDYVVRLTSDCPLIDAELIDEVINYAISNNLDYCSNCLEENYPDGQDIEIFKFSALKKTWEEAKLPSEKEHVSSYIYKNSTYQGKNIFTANNYSNISENFKSIRLTVDEKPDFEVIKLLVESLGVNLSWKAYTKYYIENDLGELNSNITRNEGYLKSLIKDKEVE